MQSHVNIPALLVLIFIHLFGIGLSQTEQYKFRHLTTEDGIPSNYTWSIMQDSQGFMWFTTRAGLCRFDGYNVKVFQYDPDDSTSISDIYAKSTITEDSNGFIWVGTLHGLNKFDPITEKFTRYYKNSDDPHSISSNRIRYTYTDRKGIVWIGTEGWGLNRYNATNDNFDSFLPSPDRTLSNSVKGIYEDQSGIFWISTGNGLYQFERKTHDFIMIGQLKDPGSSTANRFTTLTEDNKGNIWYCADKIYVFDKNKRKLTPIKELNIEMNWKSNPAYMNIMYDIFDNKQTLWIVRDGLYKYDLTSKKITTILNDPSIPDNFVGGQPRDLYRDPSGLLWIATISGITIADPGLVQIQSHPEFSSEYQFDAKSFLKDRKGHFWVGGSRGLVHFNEDMRMIHWYKPIRLKGKNTFNGNVRKIFEDSNKNIWIGCGRDGVYLLNKEINEFIPCELIGHRKGFKPDNMYDIYEDSHGTIWIGTEGLYKRMKGSLELTNFYLDTSNRFTRTTVSKIQEDRSGNLWIASITGAVLQQPADQRGTSNFIEYIHDPTDPNSLSNSHIWTVYVDEQGEVWVGTNQGLNRYVSEKNYFERYLVDLGSGGSFIYNVVGDKNGYLWLTTERGLIGFDPSEHKQVPNSSSEVKQYLSFDDIFPYKLYQDDSGIIYVGSASGSGNGYFSFNPDNITENKLLPPIVLTSFKIRNENVELDSSITSKQLLTLNYDQNFFEFEFAALDFTNPALNKYAYILEGLDKYWIYIDNRRIANYTKVPPGNYTFKVKGSNNDGYWNEEGASISITILPPPWKTWWAYSLYILIIKVSHLFLCTFNQLIETRRYILIFVYHCFNVSIFG